ncbi:MAG: hypothetical protein HOQ32_01125 [Lysobacter sp.]|nr:hypothetical protein [Lysobacter sp.]
MIVDLDDQWDGWRVRGRDLVSPDGQRINPGRLLGLLWRDAAELRRAGFASRRKAERGTRGKQYMPKVKVVIIDLADYRENGVAAS